MASVRLYDLTVDGTKNFWSPNTCKTRFALNVKGIPYEAEFVDFPNVNGVVTRLTGSDKKSTVPVIEDLSHGNKVVHESWEIAQYLEEAYPNTKSLFNGNIGVHYFFHDYCTTKLLPKIFKLCVVYIAGRFSLEEHAKWFRSTRETMFKMPIEKFAGDEQVHIKEIKERIKPIGKVLASYPFLTGTQVGWADVVLASYLHMLNSFRPELFESLVLQEPKYGKQFAAWWARMQIYMKDQPPALANL